MVTADYVSRSHTFYSLSITHTRTHVYLYSVPHLHTNSVPVQANKLTSPAVLAAMDYDRLVAFWDEPQPVLAAESSSWWKKAVAAVHGDVVYDLDATAMDLLVGQDVYCGVSAVRNYTATTTTQSASESANKAWRSAIQADFRYNWMVDGMPVAFQTEDDETITTVYTGGVPVGRRGPRTPVIDSSGTEPRYEGTTAADTFVYNHWNIVILYTQVSKGRYSVVRVTVHPFSIQHDFADDLSTVQTPIASCQAANGQQEQQHTSYDMLIDTPPQPLTAATDNDTGLVPQTIAFTYDVVWLATDGIAPKKRWNVFLDNDGAVPKVVLWMGFLIGVAVCGILAGALWTWVLRDLSYKPVMHLSLVGDDDEGNGDLSEEAAKEVQLWPLSSRVFFPPAHQGKLLVVLFGTGAQLFLFGCLYLCLLQFGIVNQSMGSNVLTAAAILYTISSLFGGYTAGRLLAIFHCNCKRDLFRICSAVATMYPVFGIVTLHVVYDMLPASTAPDYDVLSNGMALIVLWLVAVWPLTLVGGWLGHRRGAMTNFPVTQGAVGYQDLALQAGSDTDMPDAAVQSCCTKWRNVVLLLIGGILPVICSFIEYAYGVAAPVYRRTEPEYRFGLASFLLFNICAGLVTLLLYYRQLRANNYEWWWPCFITGASSGLYMFLLSISWLFYSVSTEDVDGGAFSVYFLWFVVLSLGLSFVAGFVAVACCVEFNRALYFYAMRRAND